jgi:acyl-CoA synthetase (AMP-forming)/AMP-acid ligase II
VVIDETSLWPLIEARAEATPDAVLALDDRGASIAFGAYRDRVVRVAAALAERGIGAGDAVSWQLPTWIESMILTGALARLGAVQNPILPILRRREVGFILDQVEPCLLIVPSRWNGFDYEQMARDLLSSRGAELLVCDRELPESAPTPLAPADAEVVDADAIRWILFTSGTTADPKGVLHSHRSLSSGGRGLAKALELDEDDCWAMPAPFTHVGGVGMLFVFLQTGARGALVERYEASTPDKLAEMGCTIAAGGTALVLRFLERQRQTPEVALFPKLRTAVCGAAPKPTGLHAEVRAEMGGGGVTSAYGLTEAPLCAANSLSDSDEQLACTEGRALPGCEILVVGEDGTPCPPGSVGEIRIRGPHLFKGYLDDSLTAAAFDSAGFFRSGDLGAMDEDGCIEIRGRQKDIIIRNGENISAKEIEDLLYDHPGVSDAAVIGLPDPRTGERCCAIVVPLDPEAPPTLDELVRHCRKADLATQKLPERLEIVSELPRNPTGKVLKHRLRAHYAPEESA